MGGMTSSQSTTQQQYPKFIEGFGKDVFKDASKAFDKGPHYYKGSTVTPFSQQSTGAMSGMQSLAGANSGNSGMGGNLQQIMNNGGFSDGQTQTMGSMRSLMENPFFSSTINSNGLSGDQNLVADRYRSQMNSPFSLDANPAYQSVRQQALDTQNDALSARAAAAGRYGGGMDQAILAREQGNLANRMDDSEYRNWQQRADAAASGLAGLGQTGFSNRMGAASQQGGLQGQLFNAENAGIQNMSNAYQTAMQPYQTQRAVGQEYEDLYTRQMQDKLRINDAENPFNHLQQYSSLLSGAPMSSTQTTTPSTLQMLLGGGLGTMGLLGGMGMF